MESLQWWQKGRSFRSMDKISNISAVPALFLSSEKDWVVWPRQMRILYSMCRSNEKNIISFPGQGHSSSKDVDDYSRNIEGFVNAVMRLLGEMAAGAAPVQTTHIPAIKLPGILPQLTNPSPADVVELIPALARTVSTLPNEPGPTMISDSLVDLLANESLPLGSETDELIRMIDEIQPTRFDYCVKSYEIRQELRDIRLSLKRVGIGGLAEIGEMIQAHMTAPPRTIVDEEEYVRMRGLDSNYLKMAMEDSYERQELLRQQDEFSRPGKLRIKVVSWNVDGHQHPPSTLRPALSREYTQPDIYVIGYLSLLL